MACWLLFILWFHWRAPYVPFDYGQPIASVNHTADWLDHERGLGRSRNP